MSTGPFIAERRPFIREDWLFCLVHRPFEGLIPFFFFGLDLRCLRILVESRVMVEIALCYFLDTSIAASLEQILLKGPVSSGVLAPFACAVVQLLLALHHVIDQLFALLRVLSQSISPLLDVFEDRSDAVLDLVELRLELGVVVGRRASVQFFLSFWALVVRGIKEVVGFSLEGWESSMISEHWRQVRSALA